MRQDCSALSPQSENPSAATDGPMQGWYGKNIKVVVLVTLLLGLYFLLVDMQAEAYSHKVLVI